MFVTAIVPAAGRSSRMKANKLALNYKDQTILERALAPLRGVDSIGEVIVVVAPDSRSAFERSDCRAVVNADCAEGLGSSIRTGVGAASAGTDAYLIALADMPEITTRLVVQLVEAFKRSGRGIVVPMFEGLQGHPVIFGRQYREELLALQGDIGARAIVQRHGDDVERFCTDDRAVVFDVDTPECLTMRRVAIRSWEECYRAAAKLQAANVWHRLDEGDAAGNCIGLVYYNYDEARVRALAPSGILAE